jgi:hypothetical protein
MEIVMETADWPEPEDTLHTVRGILQQRSDYRFFIVANEGGEWQLEPASQLAKHHGFSVTIEGVRTGFNWLHVVRIKREGDEWLPTQSWTQWFSRWRRKP